jgi:hypothetical protein
MASSTDTRQAAADAADILRPHRADPAIADILDSLATVGEGEGEDAGLEKAMATISAGREALIKDESVSPAQAFELGRKLEKAERALQREYMARHSVGFAKADAAKAESDRLRARNFGRAA